MANSVAIVGDSGTGKSTSYTQTPSIGITGLDPKETMIINVSAKPLPMRGWKKIYTKLSSVDKTGNYLESSDTKVISTVVKHISDVRTDIKNIVIDDKKVA